MFKERIVAPPIVGSGYPLYSTEDANGILKTGNPQAFLSGIISAFFGARLSKAVILAPNGSEQIWYDKRKPGHKLTRNSWITENVFKYCEHRKTAMQYRLPFGVRSFTPGVAGKFYANYITRKIVSTTFQNVALPLIPPSDGAARRAYWTMLPALQAEFEMLNFLAEYDDFVTPAKAVTKLFEHIDKFKDRYVKPVVELYKSMGTLRFTTAAASSALLTVDLVVKPLISDFTSLLTVLATSAQTAKDKFTQDGKLPYTSHYTEELIDYAPIEWSESNMYDMYRVVMRTSSTFNASMTRTYSVKPQNSIDDLMEYWGMELTPDVIWNAIPFSFVVDYFFSISKSLKMMQKAGRVDLSVREYCESIKTVGAHACYVRTDRDKTNIRNYVPGASIKDSQGNILASGCVNLRYSRTPTTPNYGPYLPRFKKMSTRHSLDVLALLRSFI